MKVFQLKRRILAAQILAIQKHETALAYLLVTDAESVQVNPEWITINQPEVGGYVTIDEKGVAGYMGAEELGRDYQLVGLIDLAPPEEQGAANPEPALPAGAVEAERTYTFEEFVEYGRALVPPQSLVNSMPWSFQFYGHAVTHENDQRYLVGSFPQIDFTPDDLLVVHPDGALELRTTREVAFATTPAPQIAQADEVKL